MSNLSVSKQIGQESALSGGDGMNVEETELDPFEAMNLEHMNPDSARSGIMGTMCETPDQKRFRRPSPQPRTTGKTLSELSSMSLTYFVLSLFSFLILFFVFVLFCACL